jgi:hypothetical protein
MFGPMDSNSQNLLRTFQQIQANPQEYARQLSQTNPLAYQQVLQIMNSPNPQAAVIQLAQQRGINPSMLQMLGIR